MLTTSRLETFSDGVIAIIITIIADPLSWGHRADAP
ncbi:MAG: TMEM175 family protein [Actinomycetota bacterium]